MFYRNIQEELQKWASSSPRKPLVIRGARQVGKTTAVHEFAKSFDQYIYLNLELAEDRALFAGFTDINSLVQAIFFMKNQTMDKISSTLIFIDEIQAEPKAIQTLRYFYEDKPGIPVIAAGSMLETVFDNSISFPVGRVEYKVLRPANFEEFLGAIDEKTSLEALKTVPVPDFAHAKLLKLFHLYAIIGGMPEAVKHYAENKDLTALASIYDSLLTSYLDDVEKYADNEARVQVIRHALRASITEAGKRIKFQGFGSSNYRSREMGEALRALQKALLVSIIYPCVGFTLPLLPDLKKSPRLQFLDTGLMNYFAGIQKEIFNSKDLNNVHQGIMIEHLTGQELLSVQYNALGSLNFWVREKNSSVAEVDFLIPYNSRLIPIEVKSGSDGSLKSLHIFMENASHDMAIRLYSGEIKISELTAPSGKMFRLLSLPYYLTSQISRYLDWFSER